MFNIVGGLITRMSGRERLFAYVASLAIPAVGILFLTLDNIIEKAIAAMVVVAALWLATVVALPAEERRQRTLRYSMYALLAVAMAVVMGDSLLVQIVSQAVEHVWPEAASVVRSNTSAATVLALVLVFAAHVALIVFGKDRTAMGKAAASTADELRDLDLGERLEIFCSELKDDLSRTDYSLRWNAAHYVSLDAEVDIVDRSWKERRVVDLLRALKETRSARITVVLGVPGSGKSVALRKLCRDLLAETRSTGRIPIYVNLKEWLPEFKWTNDNPPTERHLAQFVKANVRARLSDPTKPFFDETFDLLQRTGRLFFVFDSFDEIPGILDEDESSDLLNELSVIFARFIKSGRGSRGVLASRYYRQPQIQDEDCKTLEIRPFTEYQIYLAIQNVAGNAQEINQQLFDDRPDLGAASRNPFVLSLILQYIAKHQELPSNQTELYDSYINASLDLAEEQLLRRNLTRREITEIMHEAAWAMFESERFGLEIPLELLQEKLPERRIQDAFAILEGARIVRVSTPARSVSFVHRRFNEYFLVGRFQDEPARVPIEAIPQDSRWRDAIVLFAEVASHDSATRIASFCWQEVRRLGALSAFDDPTAYLRSLHSLRFLTEAFRSRAAALDGFREELGKMVFQLVSRSADLLTIKHGVEAVGLLDPNYSQSVLTTALGKENDWISQTALRSCRYLARLNVEVENKLNEFLSAIPSWRMLMDGRDLRFSLNTSDVYKRCLRFMRVKFVTDIVNLVSMACIALLFPLYVVSALLVRILMDTTPSRSGSGGAYAYALAIPDFALRACRLGIPIVGIYFFLILHYAAGKSAPSPSAEDSLQQMFEFVEVLVLNSSAGYTYLGDLGSFVFAVCMVTILPWPRIITYVGVVGILEFVKSLAKEMGKFLVGGMVIGGLLWLIHHVLVSYMGVDSQLIARLVLYFFLSVMTVLGLIAFSFGTAFRIREYRLLKKATSVFNPRREDIAKNFSALGSNWARLRYLAWVETQAGPHLAALSDPTNSWPKGVRPNIGNDSSSAMLAMLDAKWLKLDV